MIDGFVRVGPLMDAASYPVWAQQLIEECRDSKQRVVQHAFYQALRDGKLRGATVRQFLIGGWPVVEQFSLYMAHNLGKTRYRRHPGEDLARRWLMRNIRVELNHADYWVHWCQAHGVHFNELQEQEVPSQLNALNDWCWRVCTTESLAIAMAATNYAIEGATGEWSAVICEGGQYAESFPEEQRKRAMKWLKMHAQYDDAHPWEALEIICTLVGENPAPELRNELRKAVCKSYDCMFQFLECCMQMDAQQQGKARPALAAG